MINTIVWDPFVCWNDRRLPRWDRCGCRIFVGPLSEKTTMMAEPNPYQPAISASECSPSIRPSLGKPLAALVGAFACGAASVVEGEVLYLIGLIPPLSHWLDFDGEFSNLILVAMPMLAGGTGALAKLDRVSPLEAAHNLRGTGIFPLIQKIDVST